MAKRIKQGIEQSRRPINLIVSKEDASNKIQVQIQEGEKMLAKAINSQEDLRQAESEYNEWSDFNTELLLRLFDDDQVSKEYAAFSGGVYSMDPSFAERIQYVHDDINKSLNRLRSICRRLELFTVVNDMGKKNILDIDSEKLGNKIFIVHGHDDGLKQDVARLIEGLSLQPIILHEQTNQGRTIIEKFEEHSEVGLAVVLLTPDDVGGITDNLLNPRARQNVILELGYFIGKLGRKGVCALYSDGVELPSDLSGILYIKFDENGMWKVQLAREIKAAGVDVDLNQVI